jgi:hypothetical protein
VVATCYLLGVSTRRMEKLVVHVGSDERRCVLTELLAGVDGGEPAYCG